MRELYLDPSLYEYVDGLDPESYDRFCAVTDALARALFLMSKLPDACTVRAFGVTVRVERNKAQNYYIICAIHIVELDPPPEGWGANPATVLETYFELPPCVSERKLPPISDDVINFKPGKPFVVAVPFAAIGVPMLAAALTAHGAGYAAHDAGYAAHDADYAALDAVDMCAPPAPVSTSATSSLLETLARLSGHVEQ